MGTKQSPGAYDCYHKALSDEPMFTLLARDPHAPKLVRDWAAVRQRQAKLLDRTEDAQKAEEALTCADAMEAWRIANVPTWQRIASDEPPPQRHNATVFDSRCLSQLNETRTRFGAWRLWHYADINLLLSDISSANFFNPYSHILEDRDHIHITAYDGSAIAHLANTGRTVSLLLFASTIAIQIK